MDSINWNASSVAFEGMICKYNSKLFQLSCVLPVNVVGVAWVEASSVLTGSSYLLVTVTEVISYTNDKYKHYLSPLLSMIVPSTIHHMG